MTMTGDRSHRTLKDQLEFVIADMERQVAEDLDTLYGGDWCQLTDEEESVFRINPGRFPRMMMTYHCYEVFKLIATATFDDELIEQARQLHPEWCGEGVSPDEFADFAKEFARLSNRDAHAIYAKHDFWCERAGVNTYADGS
jgi:hypothetical protein